jgi:hypothetical protein
MKRIGIAVLGLFLIGAGSSTQAQMFGGRRPKDPGEHLAKIFGKNVAFTANAEVTIKNPAGEQMQAMEMTYAVSDGKVRTESDMAKMHGPSSSAGAMQQIKQMGMDRTVHIYIPATKTAYLVYPGLKAYCEVNTAQVAVEKGKEIKPPKIEETELGKETIDGHPCVKTKIVMTDDDGRQLEMLVWKATDLKNYPIQTQMTTDNKTVVTTTFKDINQTKPAASLFEPPADYKRYANMQELMMSTMQHMMPQGMPRRGGMPPQGGGGGDE